MHSYNCPNKKLVKQLERLLLALEFLFMNEFEGIILMNKNLIDIVSMVSRQL